MISVIMPSYLGVYKKAASSRDVKIIRAIKSVLNQTYEDWELIIVADGCEATVQIVKEHFSDPRIRGFKIPKQKIWSGVVRNVGLQKAEGEWACYLDIDDVLGKNHLSSIVPYLKDLDWYCFPDWEFKYGKFVMRPCAINVRGKCGTSNLIHKPDLARWNTDDNYAHDWNFIKNLKKASPRFKILTNCGYYFTCHIPGRLDI